MRRIIFKFKTQNLYNLDLAKPVKYRLREVITKFKKEKFKSGLIENRHIKLIKMNESITDCSH